MNFGMEDLMCEARAFLEKHDPKLLLEDPDSWMCANSLLGVVVDDGKKLYRLCRECWDRISRTDVEWGQVIRFRPVITVKEDTE